MPNKLYEMGGKGRVNTKKNETQRLVSGLEVSDYESSKSSSVRGIVIKSESDSHVC